jgi:MoaA/NifB/PqqE/SkfB family radical SAM enzyme
MTRFSKEPTVKRFCFTGGEPFLYLEDIKRAVATVRALGVDQPFHIVTAAKWAKSDDEVMRTLSELRALGMDLIGLSYDHEHAKWVKPEQITSVIKAAAALGIRVNLNGVFWQENESIASLLPLDELPGEIRVQNYLAVGAGRAKQASAWPRKYDLPEDRKYTCGKPNDYDVTIYPDGEVYPCCSGGMNIDAKLSCGNMNQNTAGEILTNVFTMFHARMVKEFGWGILYELVRKNAPELLPQLPKFDEADSACDICRDLNVNLAEKLRPIYEKVEIEYVKSRAKLEWRTLNRKRKATRRRLGDRNVTLSELLAAVAVDQSLRHKFLAGNIQLGARSASV